MNSLLVATLLIVGGVLAFAIWVRLPPRGTLDRLKPSGMFHGLVLFGKNGAHVKFYERSSGDRISFTKSFREGAHWVLEVTVSSHRVSAAFLEEVKSSLIALGDRFHVEVSSYEGSSQAKFCLTGTGLQDHHALEGVARLVIKNLGHPRDAKYRIYYPGPTDYKAVDSYFRR